MMSQSLQLPVAMRVSQLEPVSLLLRRCVCVLCRAQFSRCRVRCPVRSCAMCGRRMSVRRRVRRRAVCDRRMSVRRRAMCRIMCSRARGCRCREFFGFGLLLEEPP